MGKHTSEKVVARERRHRRVRARLSGTAERPRLNVFRSSEHIYAQVIDDVKGHTLLSASTIRPGSAQPAQRQDQDRGGAHRRAGGGPARQSRRHYQRGL